MARLLPRGHPQGNFFGEKRNIFGGLLGKDRGKPTFFLANGEKETSRGFLYGTGFLREGDCSIIGPGVESQRETIYFREPVEIFGGEYIWRGRIFLVRDTKRGYPGEGEYYRGGLIFRGGIFGRRS